MIPIDCSIAYLNFDAPASQPVFSLGGSGLDAIFTSALEPSTASLRFSYDWSAARKLAGGDASNPVGPGDLQAALSLLLRDNKSPNSVGIILANRYSVADDAFGVMFDADGIHNSSIGPRRGVALFMGSIQIEAQSNGLDEDATDSFISYVLLHELGHAFNLWHLPDSGSVMDPSIDAATFADPGACRPGSHRVTFEKDHREFLRRLDEGQSRYVLPGGSSFGDRPGITVADDSTTAIGVSGDGPLKLHIGLSHDRFVCCEPVEMSATVSLSAERGEQYISLLDPAYEALAIDIMGPDGVWRRFRPIFRHCHPGKMTKIEPGREVSQDFPIWRGGAGWTFDGPGRYSMRARFAVGKSVLVSNVIECEVVRANHWTGDPDLSRSDLSRDAVQAALLYKTKWDRSHSRQRLLRAALSRRDDATSSALLYTAATTAMRQSATSTDRIHRDRAIRWLEAADRCHVMTPHRRKRIRTLLETL